MISLARSGLNEKTCFALQSVFRRFPQIQTVVLYGSRAKGTHRPGSDIDLALFAPALGLPEFLRIAGEIDDLLLPYKVDLTLYHQIENPDLRDHIDRVGLKFPLTR